MENKMKETESQENKNDEFNPYAPHKIKWWGWILLAGLILGTIYIYKSEHKTNDSAEISAPWDESLIHKTEGNVFGTIYHITYMSDTDLTEGISNVLQEVDNSLSPFNKESTISAVNNNVDVEVDDRFVYVFNLAKQVSAATDGAFDITVAPLVNLWGFGFKTGGSISDSKVDSLRQFVGFNSVSLEGRKVVKEHPETMLDCSAIAKGYGVDAVADYLEHNCHCQSYMVEIGGEVRLKGCNPKGQKWSIGVTKPNDDSLSIQSELQIVLRTTNTAMATSGNYRNFYVKGGKKYAHTIDPRTGYPVQHSILSATVLASECATADAYATSFMVLGLDSAKAVLSKHKELEAYFIYSDEDGIMNEWSTEGMKMLMNK